MKYVAVSAIWLSVGGTLATMAYFGTFTNGVDAVMAVLLGGFFAFLGTLAITQ